jgi:hypothetical protein
MTHRPPSSNDKAAVKIQMPEQTVAIVGTEFKRIPHTLLSISRRIPWPYLALLVLATIVAVGNIAGTLANLPRVDEVGYGDSYIWYDVQRYVQSGRIYHDLTQPPYTPSVYSPMLYVMLSLPARWSSSLGALVGARLLILIWFVCCAALTVSITRKLLRRALPAPLIVLLILSIGILGPWLVQLRSDFMGIAFSLLSLRLLMGRWRWRFAVAGIAAGIAFLFKLTLVTAIGGGFLWLVFRKQLWPAVQFTLCALVAGPGGYLLFGLSEPHMVSHVTAIRDPVIDIHGCILMLRDLLREPVALLGLSAVPFALMAAPRVWRLLLLFAGISVITGTAFGMQAGANINYFFEFALLMIPLAGVAVITLHRVNGRQLTTNVLVALFILVLMAPPQAVISYQTISRLRIGKIKKTNDRYTALQRAMRGERIFAMVPRISILTDDPPITEPFLIRVLEIKGRFDARPLASRIRRTEFDGVVAYDHEVSWRGVENGSPTFREAIDAAYTPFCRYGDLLFRLPRNQASVSSLGERLRSIGCIPVTTE